MIPLFEGEDQGVGLFRVTLNARTTGDILRIQSAIKTNRPVNAMLVERFYVTTDPEGLQAPLSRLHAQVPLTRRCCLSASSLGVLASMPVTASRLGLLSSFLFGFLGSVGGKRTQPRYAPLKGV
jgi:hypothetical protein